METREMICINCPLGCMMTVQLAEGAVQSVTGNTCKRGEKYAVDECTNPTRMVTSSIPVEGGEMEMISVKTRDVIPKTKIKECMHALKEVKVKAPVDIGEVIVKDVARTGVDIIATRYVKAG